MQKDLYDVYAIMEKGKPEQVTECWEEYIRPVSSQKVTFVNLKLINLVDLQNTIWLGIMIRRKVLFN